MPDPATILVIDDDDDYRASTRALLEFEGYGVVEARNGQEGLAAARERRPDLVVLDVMMDSINEGYSVNQALKHLPEFREMGPIPVLMASSIELDPSNLFDWVGDAGRISPDVYMTKPLDIRRFLDNVRNLLDAQSSAPGDEQRKLA